jgi:GNAT superfamily N-acetyltransferase
MTELRKAETSDIEKIQQLNADLSEKEKEEYDPTIDPDYTLTDEAADWYRKRIENGFAQVAEKDGETIGYIIAGTHQAENFRQIHKIAELETMYLKPEHRGKGIGTEFVENFKDWAEKQDVDRLRVEASAENEGAIKFYRRNGFKDYAVTLEEDF